MSEPITVVGGGLAGAEAAWQIARLGLPVHLFEMRPIRKTEAHRTDRLAEIVCSNSLKSDRPYNASWLLKEELRQCGSLLLEIAGRCSVPAGGALAVDRERFSEAVTQAIENASGINLHRQEMTEIPDHGTVILASGPLTSPALSDSIRRLAGQDHLYFYDAISPIVDAETIDKSKVFRASRYGRDSGDYLNCPMDKASYDRFYDALVSAETVELHSFEETCFFEACLPIEEMARRGRDTLRFGPMKPVGLRNPDTGESYYAVVQLRQEDLMESSYNLVGFQNRMTFPEQRRVLQTIPGLEKATFLRLGQIHRNTYINAPDILTPALSVKNRPQVFFAGQLAGTEGYIENIATGLIAGINAVRTVKNLPAWVPPPETAMGALIRYVSTPQKHFAPMNINFGLLPPVEGARRERKQDRHKRIAERALERLGQCQPA